MGYRAFLQNLKEYCEISTIHGLPLIVANNRHILERIFWVINVIIAIVGAIALCLSNWQRFVENPTVVSLEKDFRNWHNPFPAATGCFIDRTDEELVAKFIEKRWGINETDDKYEYYVDFIEVVANVSYETMINFTRFRNDKSLNEINLLDLALKVHPILTGDLVTFDVKRKSEWDLIITEFGICFTTNSKLSDVFLAKKVNKTIESENDYLLECHYLNGLCYARYDSDPYLSIHYYVHSPYEIIHTSGTPPLLLPEKAELEINYRMQETRPATSLRRLSVSQRQCRFFDEPINNQMPAYSTSICTMLCRYHYAMKVCGCRPFFYHTLGGKICDIDGMICLSKHTEFLKQSSHKMGCNCVEPCRVITYFPQAPKMTEWVSGYFDQRVTFRWGLLHPTQRFYRDVLFGFEDLVVSFGGTASLFFGLSFLSIVEFLLFVIKKLTLYVISLKNKKKIQIEDDDDISVKDDNDFQHSRFIRGQNKLFVNVDEAPLDNQKNYSPNVFHDNWRTNIQLSRRSSRHNQIPFHN